MARTHYQVYELTYPGLDGPVGADWVWEHSPLTSGVEREVQFMEKAFARGAKIGEYHVHLLDPKESRRAVKAQEKLLAEGRGESRLDRFMDRVAKHAIESLRLDPSLDPFPMDTLLNIGL